MGSALDILTTYCVSRIVLTVKKERNADNDIEDSEEVATAYSDLFPGYPAHLKMANDLARFVCLCFLSLTHNQLFSTQEGDKLKPVGFDNYVMGEVYVTYIVRCTVFSVSYFNLLPCTCLCAVSVTQHKHMYTRMYVY